MLVPYSVDVPMIRYPFANWVLMAVIALVSIGAWIVPSRSSDQIRLVQDEQGVVHVFGDAQEPSPPLALKPRAFAVWQLVTHIFAHGDIFHLAGNLVFLFVFGNAIDAKLGHLWFILSFFFFGISAGLAWMIFGNGLPMIGSSGAIMGVTGVFLILYPRNDVVVFFWLWPLPWYVFRISSWILIVIYLALDLVFTFLDKSGGVAYVAHLGGAAVGVALAVGLLRLGWLESEFYEENLLQMCGLMQMTPRPGQKKRR